MLTRKSFTNTQISFYILKGGTSWGAHNYWTLSCIWITMSSVMPLHIYISKAKFLVTQEENDAFGDGLGGSG